jgi:hypothetical protein
MIDVKQAVQIAKAKAAEMLEKPLIWKRSSESLTRVVTFGALL